MATISIGEKGLTLVQAVKALGIADTGGQAKFLIREGRIQVNGIKADRPGQQLQAGDSFGEIGQESHRATP